MENCLSRQTIFDTPLAVARLLCALGIGILITLVPTSFVSGQMPDFSVQPKRPTAPRRGAVPKTGPVMRPKAGRPNQQNPKATAKKSQREGFPNPEEITLTTKDKVQLICTWFAPGIEPGKGKDRDRQVDGTIVAPFILLHDWDRSRRDLLLLGRFLQLSGHAVIVPDLRGHGDSLTVEGVDKPLDRSSFRKREFPTMLKDIEECKRFLIDKNDAGELNIDLLNVVAVGETSVLAMQWAVGDWSWEPIGSKKQGQDVKSLTLISPRKKLQGLSLVKGLKHPLWIGDGVPALPLLIVYGEKDARSAEEADFIYDAIDKPRTKMAAANLDPETGAKPVNTLIKAPVPGVSQGGSAIVASPRSQGMFRFVNKFVQQAVLTRQEEYLWKVRVE